PARAAGGGEPASAAREYGARGGSQGTRAYRAGADHRAGAVRDGAAGENRGFGQQEDLCVQRSENYVSGRCGFGCPIRWRRRLPTHLCDNNWRVFMNILRSAGSGLFGRMGTAAVIALLTCSTAVYGQ